MIDSGVRRLYERFGPRVAFVCIGLAFALTIVNGAVATAVCARYLGLSLHQSVTVFLLGTPAALLLALPALAVVRTQIRDVLAWSNVERRRELAPTTWHAVVGLSRGATRCCLVMYPIIPLAITYVVIHDHQSAWNFLPLMIGGTMAAGGQWVIVVAGCEVMARPMVEEVAAYLPDDFEPPAVGTSLRIRALAPLPVVTMFAAVITGAYASDVFKSGTSRLMFATAVALATTAVATAIFVLLNRSVLSPIDDLIAATRRVRHGDITTPVPLTSADELGGLAFSFNEMLADLRRHTEALRASRERIVAAADDERRRIERDLHDGAQQHLVLVGLKLRMAQRLVCTDAGAAAALLDEVHDDVERALAELRDLAHGIYPVSLQSDGLRGALREVVRRSPLPAQLDCDGAGRYRPELEAAVYFCCLEALQNAAKHAGPEARATVRLSQTGGAVRFEVSDDGRGFDPAAVTNHRSGLQNMTDRIGALGGELEIASTPTTGTTVTGTVPLESA